MGEKILLTGGSGFIGSEVVRIAVEQGHEVRILDIKPPRHDLPLVSWRQVDVRDGDRVKKELEDFSPDRVLHLASDIDISIKTLDAFTTTIDGTRNVLHAVKQLSGLKRFIHTSTQFTVRPGVEPKGERHLEPYTVYGEAKAQSEKLVWNAGLECEWLILRPTIIWGPNHPSFAREIFRHIRNGNYLHPAGRKPIMRAYGYVTNAAEQMLAFATRDGVVREKHVYYLGDDSTNYDVWADAFAVGLTGKKAKRIPVWLLALLGSAGDLAKIAGIKLPIDSGRAFRMSTSSQIDLDATHSVIGRPSVGFETGVDRTLKWLKEIYDSDNR